MLKFSIGIVVAMVVLGLPCASAADIIVNGGFENGFTGWSTTGITSVQTAAFGSGPTQGTQDALMESGDGSGFTTAAGLASFLGLSAGVLQGIATDQVTGGSAINQTITVNARDALTFDWNFLTNEATALSGGPPPPSTIWPSCRCRRGELGPPRNSLTRSPLSPRPPRNSRPKQDSPRKPSPLRRAGPTPWASALSTSPISLVIRVYCSTT